MNEPGAAPMIRRPMACMIALALGATTAVADVTITDSLGEWTTATADHAVRVTFEEPIWPVNQVLTGTWTVGGVSFQGFAGTPQPNIYVADFGSPFGTGNWLTANGDENIDITFATPTRALAFDASANEFGAAFIQYFDEAGNPVASITIPKGDVRFVGVTSDLPIRRINFASTLGAVRDTGFDMIRSAVPVRTPCIGDADGDRDIDFADITAVLASFTSAYITPGGPGDADKDGDVDFADITSALTNFNTTCP